jgi:hypothetical protein
LMIDRADHGLLDGLDDESDDASFNGLDGGAEYGTLDELNDEADDGSSMDSTTEQMADHSREQSMGSTTELRMEHSMD